jgi:hypothetical protein
LHNFGEEKFLCKLVKYVFAKPPEVMQVFFLPEGRIFSYAAGDRLRDQVNTTLDEYGFKMAQAKAEVALICRRAASNGKAEKRMPKWRGVKRTLDILAKPVR